MVAFGVLLAKTISGNMVLVLDRQRRYPASKLGEKQNNDIMKRNLDMAPETKTSAFPFCGRGKLYRPQEKQG